MKVMLSKGWYELVDYNLGWRIFPKKHIIPFQYNPSDMRDIRR